MTDVKESKIEESKLPNSNNIITNVRLGSLTATSQLPHKKETTNEDTFKVLNEDMEGSIFAVEITE